MATSTHPLQNAPIAESASTLAFMAFVTLLLLGLSAIAGGLTVQGVLGGIAIPARTLVFTIAAVVSLGFALLFGLLAVVFA